MIKYCFSLIVFVCTTNVWAWNDETTHPTISEYAAKQYFDQPFLKKTFTLEGETRFASKWIERGAKLEDAGTKWQFVNGTARSLNHFHVPTITNPTKNTLETAGLSDRATGISALVWAQSGPYQVSKGWEDWSWQKVRERYYNQLTALTQTDADANMVHTLMGLGYQMHLVQDMGHPSHVRNNTHILDGAGWKGFETWAAKNDSSIIRAGILDKKDAAGNYMYPVPQVAVDLTAKFDDTHNLAPVARLFDTRTYLGTNTPTTTVGQGLSEYTNGNFFSQDTVFAAERFATDASYKYYFPYPRKSGTDAQQFIDGNKADYISKTGEGETITHLVRSGVMSRFLLNTLGEGKRFYGSFKLDEECYLDYAKKLIPASVAYSKAMLDYFYRGAIKLTTNPGDVSFRSVKVTAENNTVGEAMGAGEVRLVIRYKALPESPLGGDKFLLGSPSTEYTYKVSAPQNVDLTTPQPLTFDFSDNPLPYFFNDMFMQLVFKGKLGNEEGAVAVSPLTPIDGIYSDFAINRPSSGIYAKTADTTSSATFNELRVTAQTDIPGGLAGGVFKLVLQYRQAKADPFQSLPVDTDPVDDTGYVIRMDEKNGVSSLQPGVPTELVFDLSTVPLPVWATDVSVIVIYADAGTSKPIAVGYHDIAEPTPIDFINNMDHVCVKTDPDPAVTTGSYLMAGSQEAIDAVGTNVAGRPNWDIYPHRLRDVYVAFTSTPASSTNYSARFPLVGPGEYGRLVVLSDYDFNVSSSVTVENIYGPLEDVWGMAFGNSVSGIRGVMNQLVYEGGEYVTYYLLMDNERGVPSWWSTHFEDAAWPAGTTCDESGAQPNLSGPVAVEFP